MCGSPHSRLGIFQSNFSALLHNNIVLLYNNLSLLIIWFWFFDLEADVEAYFKRFGKVVDVAIMRDKMTGRSRGFAFVTFKERSVESINALRNTIFDPNMSHVI